MAIVGPGGVGKTTLVRRLFEVWPDLKPYWLSGYEYAITAEVIDELASILRSQATPPHVYVVLDGAEQLKEKELLEFSARLQNYKRVRSIVITSRNRAVPPRFETMQLKGLTFFESREMLGRFAPLRFDPRSLDALIEPSQGNPLLLIIIGHLLRNQTVEQVLAQLEGDWGALYQSGTTEEQIVQEVSPTIIIANDALIERLKHAPEEIHRITPRKFEELIGDLLTDMGWEVQLTPESKDGGKDILAALNTGLGRFLCLVEAKRYGPTRPIQVGLVRQLYGTLIDHGANSAMLVTSSRFTKGARDFQSNHEYLISLKEYSDIVGWIQNYKGGH
jgi:restriction system protein